MVVQQAAAKAAAQAAVARVAPGDRPTAETVEVAARQEVVAMPRAERPRPARAGGPARVVVASAAVEEAAQPDAAARVAEVGAA